MSLDTIEYRPRGMVATLIEAMSATPDRVVWTADQIAQQMGVDKGTLSNRLQAAISHQHLYHRTEGGPGVKGGRGASVYSLQPFPSEAEPLPPAGPTISTTSNGWRPAVMVPPRGDAGFVRSTSPARRPLPDAAPLRIPTFTGEAALALVDAPARTLEPDAQGEPAPFEEPEEQVHEDESSDAEAVEFDACVWLDGTVVVYGAQQNEDGSITLTREQLEEILEMTGRRAAA